MKFYGTPGLAVMDYNVPCKLAQFDENGEFETDNEPLIKRMGHHFKHEKVPKVEPRPKTKRTVKKNGE